MAKNLTGALPENLTILTLQICSVVVKAPKRQANFYCKFDAFKAI